MKISWYNLFGGAGGGVQHRHSVFAVIISRSRHLSTSNLNTFGMLWEMVAYAPTISHAFTSGGPKPA